MHKALYWLNKNPILYDGKHFKLVYFGLFTGIGTFFAVSLFFAYLNYLNIPIKYSLNYLAIMSVLLMLLFSKLMHPFVIGKAFFQDPKKYISQTVFYNQGGQIGYFMAMFIGSYIEDIHFLIFLDAYCYGGCLASAIGRIGCYNYGCCFGKPVKDGFGITYTNLNAKVLRLHPELLNVELAPTQLISASFDFLLFFLLTLVIHFHLNTRAGIISLIFILAYNTFRMITNPLRCNEKYATELRENKTLGWFSGFLSLLTFVLGVSIIIFHKYLPDIHTSNDFTFWFYFQHTFMNLENFFGAFISGFIVFVAHSYHKVLGRHF